jgi:hypothetical protein
MAVERRNVLGPSVPQIPPTPASGSLDASGSDRNSGSSRGDSLVSFYRQGRDRYSTASDATGGGLGIGNADNFRTAPGSTDAGPGTVVGLRDQLSVTPGGDTGTDGGGRAIL